MEMLCNFFEIVNLNRKVLDFGILIRYVCMYIDVSSDSESHIDIICDL